MAGRAELTLISGVFSPTVRVGIVCDYAEERWPSMDLYAEMLLENLSGGGLAIEPVRLQPRFVRRLSRLNPDNRLTLKGDRVINRMFDYPRYVRRLRGDFDVFHVADHSYSHLVKELPADRTLVSCHDLDTFRCLLAPDQEPRSVLFRMMVRRIIEGLRHAGRVACGSATTRAQLAYYDLLAPERAAVIHYGVAPEYLVAPEPEAEREARRLLGTLRADSIELLNVGSTIQRKRIDVLLRVFAAARARYPAARLIRAGGPLTRSQRELARSLKIDDRIVELPLVGRAVLAAIYRRAVLTLCPSEAEGFGLPLLESIASGTPVLASDIAAAHEVGGEMASYVPVDEIEAWSEALTRLLEERRRRPCQWQVRRRMGIERARKFSWQESAARVAGLYRELSG